MWRGNKIILFQVFPIQKITDMLSSNHSLFLYTKLMTVLNKEDWQSMKKNMSHHSKHHFITQYISLRGTAVDEFYRMKRMGVAGHVRGNRTEINE